MPKYKAKHKIQSDEEMRQEILNQTKLIEETEFDDNVILGSTIGGKFKPKHEGAIKRYKERKRMKYKR